MAFVACLPSFAFFGYSNNSTLFPLNSFFSFFSFFLPRLLQLFSSRAGGLVQWAVGGGLGWLSAASLRLGIGIPTELHDQLEVTGTAIGAFLVTVLVQWIQAHFNIKVQKVLDAPLDGYIGPKTVRKAEIMRDTLEDLRGV